jgi:hypothetical protein
MSLDSKIEIKIIELSPTDSTYQIELIKQVVDFNYLFEAIYDSLDNMLKEFGLIGFKMKWEIGNFPICEYLKLKAGRYCLSLPREQRGEDFDWIYKVPIQNEVDLILL